MGAGHRLRVAEAMLLIVLARVLVSRARFGRWRNSLGDVVNPATANAPGPSPHAVRDAHDCAHAVNRAALRLPASLCLPKAMALQWMLRRRRIAARLVLGSLPGGERRGSLHDLHAWVEIGGERLLDTTVGGHRPVMALETTK